MYSSRAYEMAQREAEVDELIQVKHTADALDKIDRRLGGHDVIGLERRTIPASMEDRFLQSLSVTSAVDISEELRWTRVEKDETELGYLREAARQSDRAHERAREVLDPGMEEVEFAAEVEAAARAAGHEGILAHGRFDAYLPYGLIVSGSNISEMGSYAYVSHGTGPTRAFPVSAGHRTIERNDPVLVDIGGVHYGYNADVSRSYIAGSDPSSRLCEAHDALNRVYERTKSLLIAGVTAGEVYQRTLEAAEETPFSANFQGNDDCSGRFVGHGIGLEIDEPPVLSPGNERELPENAVVTIEIYFVFPNNGGVKIEESCRVRADAPPEELSSIPRQLFVNN